MIIIVANKLVSKGFLAMTLYPFIILKTSSLKENELLINHEKIHLKQQIEMLVVFFYLWYGIEFLVRIVQFKNLNTAYRNISFEREAYQNEHDTKYFKERKFWNFLHYLNKKSRL